MFLAIRELVFARGRFALMGLVVALVAVLVVLLSGLSVGLVNDGVSGLKKLPVTSFAFQDGIAKDSAFSRSRVDTQAVKTWSAQPGVAHAAPYGNTLVNARTQDGVEIDLALFGVEVGSFIDPAVAEGQRLAGPAELVVGEDAVEAGVQLGDTVTIEPLGTQLRVVGVAPGQHTFGHVDVAYLPIRSWQEIASGVREGDTVPAHVYEEVTAVAVQASTGATVDLAAGDAAAGTSSLTLKQSFAASPGYSAETSTLQLIQAFLYAISALVVGAFFTVLIVQRRQEIAVLRAMGASTGYLLRDTLLQSLILLVVSAGVGVGLGVIAGVAIASTPIPFALEVAPIAGATLLLLCLGLLGAGGAVLRVTRVDPLAALGESR